MQNTKEQIKNCLIFIIGLWVFAYCNTSRQSCVSLANIDVEQFCSYTLVSKNPAVDVACVYSILELEDCKKKDNTWPVETK
ncbi:hypothetical protein [Leptospira kmetyi]|uniref:Uncharacterized protein n=1 Tax=Leptospira kmetyi TaxID=408139 RepID=A0ABX4N3H7_9LEPT|nr:hypothetical protein [Leptospira kmetyi]PJZ27873.1 hypothetical protein CH378_20780 [Leptospira kmetyi]PJZ39704.1 hypothetical protein CH370_19820 [Leptospira kmetyi]